MDCPADWPGRLCTMRKLPFFRCNRNTGLRACLCSEGSWAHWCPFPCISYRCTCKRNTWHLSELSATASVCGRTPKTADFGTADLPPNVCFCSLTGSWTIWEPRVPAGTWSWQVISKPHQNLRKMTWFCCPSCCSAIGRTNMRCLSSVFIALWVLAPPPPGPLEVDCHDIRQDNQPPHHTCGSCCPG